VFVNAESGEDGQDSYRILGPVSKGMLKNPSNVSGSPWRTMHGHGTPGFFNKLPIRQVLIQTNKISENQGKIKSGSDLSEPLLFICQSYY
jgi:hypothetical protein